MKGMVIYKSKYGASKKYAEWISEATGFPCVTTKEADINEVTKCDVIIIGGGIYASGIACVSYLKKNIGKLKGKKIIVFTCGASPYDEKSVNEIIKRNMKDDLEGIPVYYCRGSFDMKEMSFADRTLCGMLRKSLAKKDPKEMEVWERALMEATDNEAHDWTDKSYIESVLAAL
jgi:menaquinone-dependent protoporphyrinogen IX oxidase